MEQIRVFRMTAIEELKKKFTGNNPASWSKNSNKKLAEMYAEFILQDKTKKVKLFP